MRGPGFVVVDQGGHATRCTLFDAHGQRLARAEHAIATRRDDAGRVEHDAKDVLHSLFACLEAVVNSDAASNCDALTIGLACQRSSVVAWDRRDGRPLSPVLSWQDTRASAELSEAQLDPLELRVQSGLRASVHYGAAKLAWLRRHQPGLQQALNAGTLCWGPLASFLAFHLDAERRYTVSHSIAQRSLLFDRRSGDWSPALCAAFDIPSASLPRCLPDLADHGEARIGARRLPIRLSAGDQNLLPAACPDAPAVLNLGTGGFVLVPADEVSEGSDPRANELLCSVLPAASTPPPWAWEATLNGCGAAFDWLAERYGVTALPWETWQPGSASPALFLNRVGGLGSPFWQAERAPRFLQPPESLAEAMQSVAEAVGFLLRANLEVLHALGRRPAWLLTGGGLSRNDGLCSLLADAAGCRLEVSADSELSTRGALALLRAQAGLPALPPLPRPRIFQPRGDSDAINARYRRWREALTNEP